MVSARGSDEGAAFAASRWLLAISIAGAALAIGSVHTITLCVVAGVLAVSTLLAWWNAEPAHVRPAATVVLFTGVALTAYTALQCVPLPMRLLAVIAPHNADVWSQVLAPLDEPGPRWAPLSLDPIASRVEALKGLAYLFAFLTALRVARRREGVTFVSAAIVLTGVVIGVLAMVHPALDAKKLYGLYTPGWEIQPRHIAPLLNPNHLAAYLNVGFCLSLAAAISRESGVPRPIAGAVALVLVGFQVWVASRGGVGAMAIGAVAIGLLALASRAEKKDPRKWLTIASGAAAIVGVAVVVLVTFPEASSELSSREMSKFKVLLDIPQMLAAYGVWGAGRGAFESTYPRFSHGDWNLTITNPENLLAQWTTEWGVPVAVAGLVGLAIALRPTGVLARFRLAAGAWAALLAVGVQNMADYSSEVPGVMIAVAVCGAIVVAGSAGRPARSLERWSFAPRTIAVSAVVLASFGILGAATTIGRQLADDEETLHALIAAPDPSVDRVADFVRGAMLRHPSEPFLPYAMAVASARARRLSTFRWINATLERARVYGLAHYLLAHIVAARSPSQARLEYRLAYEQARDFQGPAESESPRLVGSYDDAMELVSSGDRGVDMLGALVPALADRLPSTSARLDAVLVARGGMSLDPARRAAQHAVQDLEAGDAAPWCSDAERQTCAERAESLSKRLQEIEPARCEGHQLEARALAAAGQPAQALDELQRAADTVRNRDDCLKALETMAIAAHDEPRAESALDQLAKCANQDCLDDVLWAARTQEQQGKPQKALIAYKHAQEIAPANDAILENVARLDAQIGLHSEALGAFQMLARRHSDDRRWTDAIESQRKALLNL